MRIFRYSGLSLGRIADNACNGDKTRDDRCGHGISLPGRKCAHFLCGIESYMGKEDPGGKSASGSFFGRGSCLFTGGVLKRIIKRETYICPKGSEHFINNTGDEDLVMVTVVVKK